MFRWDLAKEGRDPAKNGDRIHFMLWSEANTVILEFYTSHSESLLFRFCRELRHLFGPSEQDSGELLCLIPCARGCKFTHLITDLIEIIQTCISCISTDFLCRIFTKSVCSLSVRPLNERHTGNKPFTPESDQLQFSLLILSPEITCSKREFGIW